jgi:murein DD-endopeptidase MepM/ murein hydrolase activator NlpD
MADSTGSRGRPGGRRLGRPAQRGGPTRPGTHGPADAAPASSQPPAEGRAKPPRPGPAAGSAPRGRPGQIALGRPAQRVLSKESSTVADGAPQSPAGEAPSKRRRLPPGPWLALVGAVLALGVAALVLPQDDLPELDDAPQATEAEMPERTPEADWASKPKWEAPLGNGAPHVTSCFGMRRLEGRTRLHGGVDLRGRPHTFIRAMARGRVRRAGYHRGFGNFVEVDHLNGWTTLYAHMVKRKAERGQWVEPRDVLGYVGNTGYSFGPHLHLELRYHGKRVDPLGALRCTFHGDRIRFEADCELPPRLCPPADSVTAKAAPADGRTSSR